MNTRSKKSAAPAYDVVIAGGGMTGSFLAAALGSSGLKVAVVERQPLSINAVADHDLRVSALTLASRTMFETLGAWEGVERRRLAPVRAMEVWEQNGGEIRFDAAEIGEPCLAYIVENRIIVAALQERLQQHTNIHWIQDGIAGMSIDDDVQIELANDRTLRARLLVAADGADSIVRERLGIARREIDLAQQGIVANVRTERPHTNLALQRFLSTGPLAFLPLDESDLCSIVWSADQSRAEALMGLDDSAFAGELVAAIEGRLGQVQVHGPRAAFPLALTHAEQYVQERIALIGDAAHTVHPLAGQGVNLGFLDAAALAEVLEEAVHARRDIGAHHVLRRYERWRRGDNLAMLAVTGGFRYVFGNEWPLLARLRTLGFGGAHRLTPLKGLIMRRAAGLSGDLPRIARRA